MGRTAGSGQGSIYKRGDKWRGQITINGQRRSFTSAKKKDVIDWIANIKVNGAPIARQNITVKELGDEWLTREKEPTLSPQAFYQLRLRLNKYIYAAFGDRKVQSLTRDEIEDFYREYLLGKAGNSVAVEVEKRFKELLRYAVKENIIQTNPHEYAVVPKSKSISRVEAFTPEEQEKIVAYLKKNMNSINMLFYLLLTTGMRVSEACALTWDDVDLKTGAINIDKIIVRYCGTTVVQNHPKTASSVRTVYMSSTVLRYMKQYYGDARVKGKLFETNGGNWQTAHNLRPRWQKICAEIGIPYRGMHSLRHTFATRALEKGIDIKTVSRILGHRSVVTTMNIYQDVYSSQKIKAVEMLDDLF